MQQKALTLLQLTFSSPISVSAAIFVSQHVHRPLPNNAVKPVRMRIKGVRPLVRMLLYCKARVS